MARIFASASKARISGKTAITIPALAPDRFRIPSANPQNLQIVKDYAKAFATLAPFGVNALR
jgi:hypothetical protein